MNGTWPFGWRDGERDNVPGGRRETGVRAVVIEKASGSQHQRIAQVLRQEIRDGVWPIGSKLPSENSLSERFGVAPGTIRLAVNTLRDEGAVAGGRGVAKTVSGVVEPPVPFDAFRSFAQWAEQDGRRVGGLVDSKTWADASPEDAEALGVPLGSPVLVVRRSRTLDGVAVMVERTRYARRVGLIVDALPEDCASVTRALAENGGIIFARAEHVFEAGAAGEDDARLLGIEQGSAMLSHHRVSYDGTGRALERSEDRYRSGVIAVAVVNTRSANPLRWTSSRNAPLGGSGAAG